MLLANARQTKTEEATDDDIPSTSGRQLNETGSYVSSSKILDEVLVETSLNFMH